MRFVFYKVQDEKNLLQNNENISFLG